MLTTDLIPGSPCWIDLGAPDVDAAVAFYGSVFGWEYRPFESEGDGYGFFQMDGRTVAAVGPLTEEGASSAWMIYFATPDAQATAQTVEGSGGTVRVAPFDVNGEARMAQFTDPLGGEFAVWQAVKNQGLEAVNEPGALNWIEHYTTDADAAKEFYGTVFGWTTQGMPLPGGGGTYWLINPSGHGEERMQGGIMQLAAEDLALSGGRPYWHPVFEVADCDAAVARVAENGGSVQMGPEDAEGVGRLAVCLDLSGADFVLLTPTEG
ncbi:VOC family protein [Allosalinactinospora lopnorensis]|uniref:VOC family protein n=1 Tax=Allosalinactinospora lopnorensis TaxID=1352348 RepID=UPI000623F551|nr:VOC family protein [Allosalinactinospora lopnorensis]